MRRISGGIFADQPRNGQAKSAIGMFGQPCCEELGIVLCKDFAENFPAKGLRRQADAVAKADDRFRRPVLRRQLVADKVVGGFAAVVPVAIKQ